MDRKDLCMPISAFVLTTVRLAPGVLNMQLPWLLRNAASNLGSNGIIVEPARETDKLEAGIWLTIMMWLSSKEMLQCSTSCCTLCKLVAPGGLALQFWKRHCNMKYVGIHSMEVVCLHAAASSSVIAHYMERAKHVRVAGELRFQASQELTAFAAAFDYAVMQAPGIYFATGGMALPQACSQISAERNLVAAQWTFDTQEVACFCQSTGIPVGNPVRSKAVKFWWPVCPGKTIDIHVYMLLCMTSDGRLMLAWETSMSTALEQDFDYVEFLLSGVAIDASEDANMPVAILPYSGNGAYVSPSPVAGCQMVCSLFRTGSSTFQTIRSGKPLTCIVDFVLKSSGDQQDIMC